MLDVAQKGFPDRNIASIVQRRSDVKRGRTSRNIGERTVVLFPGDHIQRAIDAMNKEGGGTVILRAGTYYPNYNIDIKDNIRLIGDGLGQVVINFAYQSYSLRGIGTGLYNTGTVSCTNGSTVVTGVGVDWITNLTTSHKIVVDEWVYEITSIDNGQQITLSTPYGGKTGSGLSYTASVMVNNFSIQNIVIVASATHGFDFQYCDLGFIEDSFSLANLGRGFNGLHFHRGLIDTLVSQSNGSDGFYIDTAHISWFNWMAAYGNAGIGIHLDDCDNSILDNGLANDSAGIGILIESTERMLIGRMSINSGSGIGMKMDTCNNCTTHALVSRNNGSDGIYLTGSGSNAFQSVTCSDNAGEGISIDANSDKNRVFGGAFIGNGAYGVNIENANCDKNIIALNDLSGNTSGGLSDSGTGTVNSGNVT